MVNLHRKPRFYLGFIFPESPSIHEKSATLGVMALSANKSSDRTLLLILFTNMNAVGDKMINGSEAILTGMNLVNPIQT